MPYCTFYRPDSINTMEMENIIGKLAYDLHLLETGQFKMSEADNYVFSLIRDARPLEKNPAMSFFGFAAPNTMPSDSRVLYFYRPTYLAAAFMMKAVLLNPDLLDEARFPGTDLIDSPKMVRDTLASCLLGCTGRGFDGAGHLPVRDCVRLFEEAGAPEFIEKYPELCPEFASLYRDKKAFVESGAIDPQEAWYNHFR